MAHEVAKVNLCKENLWKGGAVAGWLVLEGPPLVSQGEGSIGDERNGDTGRERGYSACTGVYWMHVAVVETQD